MQFCEEPPLIDSQMRIADLSLSYMGEPEDRTLFIRNIPRTWGEWELFQIIRRFGRIDNIKIVRRGNKSASTYAFVYMMSVADANAVVTATADNDGMLPISELAKPLKIQFMKRKNACSQAELCLANRRDAVEEVQSYFSMDSARLGYKEGNIPKPIIYNKRLHRHMYLPCGKSLQVELVKPVLESSHGPMIFYVLMQNVMFEGENLVICNEDFENHLAAHFKRAAKVEKVTIDELLVAAPRKESERPLRCRVLEKFDNNKVRIYALDTGQTLVVKMDELRVITEYLASTPARAIPCALYGISKPTADFAKVASRLLENFDRITVRVVSFEGAFSLVRVFQSNEFSAKEVAKILADGGVCEYTLPEQRKVYDRKTILSLKKQKAHSPILDAEVARAIMIKPE